MRRLRASRGPAARTTTCRVRPRPRPLGVPRLDTTRGDTSARTPGDAALTVAIWQARHWADTR